MFVSSLVLSGLTVITFGFAMSAIPSAGPYCPGNCMDYPYLVKDKIIELL